MRLSVLSSIRWLPALVVVGLALPAAAQGRAGNDRSAGELFTEPTARSVTVTTNAPKGPGLSDWIGLDAGVRKPFEVFNSSDSFSGTRTPPPMRRPPPSAAETKRFKEAMDRKKNWAFLTPEEIYGLQSPEEVMELTEFGKDGAIVEPKTPLERYLERMEKSRAANANTADKDALAPYRTTQEKDEELKLGDKPVLSFLNEARAKTADTTTKSPNDFGFTAPFTSSAFSDRNPGGLFNNAPAVPTLNPFAKTPAQETTMKEFNQSWDSRSGFPSFNTSLGVSTPATASPATTPFSLGGPSPNSAGDALQPRSTLTAPATFGVAVPGYSPAYNPAPALLPPPTPSPRVKPPPAFELPTRKF